MKERRERRRENGRKGTSRNQAKKKSVLLKKKRKILNSFRGTKLLTRREFLKIHLLNSYGRNPQIKLLFKLPLPLPPFCSLPFPTSTGKVKIIKKIRICFFYFSRPYPGFSGCFQIDPFLTLKIRNFK